MIDWWGPILHEYYSSTEGNGVTTLNTEEWLAHPGSVGRPLLGDHSYLRRRRQRVAAGETGLVYFERDQLPFDYHNDPDKTRAAQHPRHPAWTAVGDIGRVDSDGYLYLTDRRAFMIISGGVNIYPQAIEDALVVHPDVLDAAVIGVPDAEMGEQVKAIVEPAAGVSAIGSARGKAARLPADQGGALHGAALGRLHRRDAAPAHRQALQAGAA